MTDEESYITVKNHNIAKNIYKQQILKLNNQLFELNKNAYGNEHLIFLLKAQVKKLVKQMKELKINIVEPQTDSEEGFKQLNDDIMTARGFGDKQKAEIRRLNEIVISKLLK